MRELLNKPDLENFNKHKKEILSVFNFLNIEPVREIQQKDKVYLEISISLPNYQYYIYQCGGILFYNNDLTRYDDGVSTQKISGFKFITDRDRYDRRNAFEVFFSYLGSMDGIFDNFNTQLKFLKEIKITLERFLGYYVDNHINKLKVTHNSSNSKYYINHVGYYYNFSNGKNIEIRKEYNKNKYKISFGWEISSSFGKSNYQESIKHFVDQVFAKGFIVKKDLYLNKKFAPEIYNVKEDSLKNFNELLLKVTEYSFESDLKSLESISQSLTHLEIHLVEKRKILEELSTLFNKIQKDDKIIDNLKNLLKENLNRVELIIKNDENKLVKLYNKYLIETQRSINERLNKHLDVNETTNEEVVKWLISG